MDSSDALNALAALSQETRLAIHRRWSRPVRRFSVGEIGAAVKAAPATLSFHLKALANAGLGQARQDGRYIYYSADYGRMNALVAFLTENCCARDCPASCAPASRATERKKS